MPRGVAWDALPVLHEKSNGKVSSKKVDTEEQSQADTEIKPERKFNLLNDLEDIGRRTAFGAVCGGLTGASFGFMEIIRSPKLLSGKKTEATQKLIAYTSRFAGFFALYHSSRKFLHLYVPLTPEMNITSAAAISLAPLAVMPMLRPMFPYGLVMVGLDAYSSLTEEKK